ncbi:MAG: GNAT family N-acetyltransferase, partial [Acidimicrobiia bacterium]
SASPPAVDEHLTRLRFSIEGETVVMTGPVVPAAPRDESPEPALVGSSAPSPAWRAVQQRWMGIDDPEAWDRVLARVASPALFAEARDGDGLVAAGLGVVRRGWLGIFEVATDPEHRRRGHGTRLVQGLMAWATTAGATRVFLQVVASNEAATGLYRGLGFVEAYRYWYRRPAPESRSTMRPSPAASG